MNRSLVGYSLATAGLSLASISSAFAVADQWATDAATYFGGTGLDNVNTYVAGIVVLIGTIWVVRKVMGR